MILTTKDIANLPGNFEFKTANDVAKLCREGKIFAYRKEENFAPWEISSESFAMYLSYNKARKKSYFNSQFSENLFKKDEHMKKVVSAINNALGHQIDQKEESYTVDQVSDILQIPKNQVQSIFISSSLPVRFFARIISSRIPVLKILDYLKIHPEQVTVLQNRHREMLEKKDPRESLIRHTLMLYAYYKDNGYLV